MPVLSRVRTKLADLAASLDASAVRLPRIVVTFFAWPLLYAVTLGSGVFVIRHLSWVHVLDDNKVPLGDSVKMVLWVAAALIALGIVYAVAVPVARWRARRRAMSPPTAGAVLAALHRRLRPLLLLPVIPALSHDAIERDSPKETLFLIALAGAIAGASAYAWLRPTPSLGSSLDEDDAPPPRRRRERLARASAALVIVALWAAYGWFFARQSIINHHALHTATLDLGIYDNIFYQSAHGHPLACSFAKAGYHGSAHFDPILVLLSPLYLLYPRAEFLLVLQSVWLGAGVIPVYLLARHFRLSRFAGVAIAAMYALYPALHGATMYEFHSLALITPVLMTLLYLLESGRHHGYWALLLPTLLVREDVSILLCFVGAYAILTRRPGWVRLGWLTIVACFVYFVIVKRFFMTSIDVLNSGKDSYSFAYYYEDLIPNHNGGAGLLVSLLTNPVFVLKNVLSEPKILYLCTLFVPLAFLPFMARPGRVMLGWGLAFCLLASRSAVFSTHFQYSCLIIPAAFAITPAALRRIEDGGLFHDPGIDHARLRGAFLWAAFVASVLCSWKFGGIVENQTFRGGFATVARSLSEKDIEKYAWVRQQVDRMPPQDSVAVTNRMGAHCANRRRVYYYSEHTDVDWLFLDESELHGGDLDKHRATMATGNFEQVSKYERLSLYKRKKKP